MRQLRRHLRLLVVRVGQASWPAVFLVPFPLPDANHKASGSFFIALRPMPMRVSPALILASLISCAEPHPHACTVLGEPALCATLPVYENRTTPAGRRIDLNVLILPARQKAHAPDPLFLLHGGPGAAATELAPV